MHLRVFAIAAAMAASISAATAAECTSPGINRAPQFCSGCTYEVTLGVKKDTPCERPYRPNSGGVSATGTATELLGNSIVKRASHGIAGVEGNTFAYSPAKGYVGPDDFTVVMNYRQGKEVAKFFVHFVVKVE